MLTDFFSAIAPITASSENVPNSQSSAYRRKYHHLFKQNVSSAHTLLFKIQFLVNIWYHGKNLQVLIVLVHENHDK